MSILHIQLLGAFRLADAVNQIIPIDQPRQRALLAYLLLQRKAPQARQQIAFLFWPDTSEAQAHTNLRQLLHHLRRAWPGIDDVVQITSKTLQWKTTVLYELDIAAFEQALDRASQARSAAQSETARTALTEAVARYAGDLLPGCYEEWLLPERERLRQQFFDAVQQLIVLCENESDYPTAIHYAQRLLRADPLHETTYRRLMRLYVLNDDRAAALHVYHICTTTLARELDVAPSQETHEAYERLLRREQPAILRPLFVRPANRERLVGRQSAWERLLAAWQNAARGRAQIVCISGEAGIGKTRLAEELLNWAHHQGITQARTRAYATEGNLAYAPITDWLRSVLLQPAHKQLSDHWLSEVARLLPELLDERPTLPRPEALTERWQRQRFFEAMARALLNGGQPLLLLIDDLQWCDRETLEWLSYLLRYDANARLLLIATLRPEDVTEQEPLTSFFHHLHTTGQLSEIQLERFSAEETTALASQLTASPINTVAAQRLFAESEGNPLFIVETVRAELNGAGDKETRRPGDCGGSSNPGAPHSAELTRSRSRVELAPKPLPAPLSALPPTIYHVIQQRLAQISPLAHEVAALAATIGRSFTFDLLSQASHLAEDEVVRGLDELWQRRIIREQGANAYDFSHDRIREVVYGEVSPLRRRLLHRHVFQAMEESYRENLDAVCGQLAVHSEMAGLLPQAVSYYRRVATVAHQLLAYPELETHLRKSLALFDKLPATQEHLQQKLDILTYLGSILMVVKGFTAPEVEEFLSQARALCYLVGNNQTRFEVLASLRTYWIKHCRWDIAAELGEELLALADETGEPVHLQVALRCLGGIAFHQGRLQDAYGHLGRAIEHFDRNQRLNNVHDHEQDQGIANLRYSMGPLWLLGYPDQAQARMKEMLRRTRQLARPFDILFSIDFAMDLEHRLHRSQAAQELAAEYSTLNAIHQFPYCISYEMVFRGWSLCAQGATGEGIALLEQGLARLHEMQVFLFWPQVITLQIDAYRMAKRYAQGVALIDETLAFVAKTGESYWNAEFQRCKGEFLQAMAGAPNEIEACYQQALAISRQQSARSLELRAATSLACLWQQQGKQTEAHALLSEIYGWFSEGFDTADLQEAKALLEQLRS